MSILVDQNTRLIVQGITGREGSFHTLQSMAYGTAVVAGVTPGKGGSTHEGIPVFNSMWEACRETGGNASVIFVPPKVGADAIMEAVDAMVELVVFITVGIPTLDMIKVRHFMSSHNSRLVGPNCPGVISPGKCKIGIMPGSIHQAGSVGVISRSGTLTYEAVQQLSSRGIGQSTCIGIGGDPIIGTSFVDLLKLFNKDQDTSAVVLIGEIGGTAEEEASEFLKNHKIKKPVVGFIAGITAPKGRKMGHAGAIISGGKGGAKDKIKKMEECGITIAVSYTHLTLPTNREV